jgi:hypothetical protein
VKQLFEYCSLVERIERLDVLIAMPDSAVNESRNASPMDPPESPSLASIDVKPSKFKFGAVNVSKPSFASIASLFTAPIIAPTSHHLPSEPRHVSAVTVSQQQVTVHEPFTIRPLECLSNHEIYALIRLCSEINRIDMIYSLWKVRVCF